MNSCALSLDQAVYTSVQAARGSGYQLAGWSAGVTAAEQRELARWGPSHDSLQDPSAPSVNFHRLATGRYCVSRTLATGAEYSGRGAQVYTQIALLQPGQMAAFHWHPFRLVRAIAMQEAWPVFENVPARMPILEIEEQDDPLSASQLAEDLVGQLHRQAWNVLIKALESGQPVAVECGGGMARVAAALFSCLPVDCRAGLTFTSGLKWSPQRSFRLFPWPHDAGEQRRMQRASQFRVARLEVVPAPASGKQAPHRSAWRRPSQATVQTMESSPESAWAALLAEVSERGLWPEFVAWLADASCQPHLEDVDSFAPRARAALGLAE